MKLPLRSICIVGLAGLASLGTGCASRAPETVIAVDSDKLQTVSITKEQAADGVICTKVQQTGTRFPVTECATKQQRDDRTRDQRDTFEKQNRSFVIPPR